MLAWEDDVDVEVDALRKQGRSISATARHTGRNRKTIRAYLNDEHTLESLNEPNPFAPFVEYVSCRPAEDPHQPSPTTKPHEECAEPSFNERHHWRRIVAARGWQRDVAGGAQAPEAYRL